MSIPAMFWMWVIWVFFIGGSFSCIFVAGSWLEDSDGETAAEVRLQLLERVHQPLHTGGGRWTVRAEESQDPEWQVIFVFSVCVSTCVCSCHKVKWLFLLSVIDQWNTCMSLSGELHVYRLLHVDQSEAVAGADAAAAAVDEATQRSHHSAGEQFHKQLCLAGRDEAHD